MSSADTKDFGLAPLSATQRRVLRRECNFNGTANDSDTQLSRETTGVLRGKEAIYKTRLEEKETSFHLEQNFKTIADSLSRVALDYRIWGSLYFSIPHFLATWAISI